MAGINNFVPRVNQLDAIQLDKDILRLLQENFFGPIQKYAPIIYVKFHPELDLLLHASVWICSVGRRMSSFGQDILLISYSKDQLTTSRLCLHFLLTVVPKYIKTNSEQRFFSNELLSKFLKTGKKPTLIDFLLGLDFIALQGVPKREIGYRHMTRELLWGGYMELLGLVIPLINYKKLKRIAKECFMSSKEQISREAVTPHFDVDTICAYCSDRPSLPHHMGCGHVFCYYCLHANLLTDPEFRCPLCQCKKIKVMPVGNFDSL